MTNRDSTQNELKLTDRATLSLLSVLETNEPHTQRGLAQRIGIALGLTNSLMKRAVQKGLVKISTVPARRYSYYLTPEGFREKSRLVGEYLNSSLSFFRRARDEYEFIFAQALKCGHKRIALYGIGELAEIAILSANQYDIELCGVVHIGGNQSHFSGVRIYNGMEAVLAENVDAAVISTTTLPQDAYDHLVRDFGADRVFAPPLLHISRNTKGEE